MHTWLGLRSPFGSPAGQQSCLSQMLGEDEEELGKSRCTGGQDWNVRQKGGGEGRDDDRITQ